MTQYSGEFNKVDDALDIDSIQQSAPPGVLQILILAVVSLLLLFVLVICWNATPAMRTLPEIRTHSPVFSESTEVVFQRISVGPNPTGYPRISNLKIVDLEGNGEKQILACDAGRSALFRYQRDSAGEWTEQIIAADLGAPAHATVVDIDGDSDNDILVALLGNLEPDDGVIGSVVLLENQSGAYIRHTILDDIRRVADVQSGDFDGDGDLDLAVAVFGYSRGQVLWLENLGGFKFKEHELLSAPGVIHVPVADFNGDGLLDIAAIVTQDEEELWLFESSGKGQFKRRMLHRWMNYDLGGAGLVAADLDGDGDMDLVVPVGDNLEDLDPFPQPYHGCFWFENLGDGNFIPHRIAEFGGTYAASVVDLNSDGHQDVVLVSMTNNGLRSGQPSIVWLENDGNQNFQTWTIDHSPTHLVTVACGDLTGNGRPDIVAGGLHLRAPFDHIGRITAWLQSEGPE